MKKLISIVVAAAIIAALILIYPLVSQHESEGKTSPAASAGDIVISEVMTNNKGVYPDDEGNSSDWAELYNTTDHAVDIGNYMLSDDESDLTKWIFPQTTLEAHSYFVVFMTGNSKYDVSNSILHSSFKLSSEGETLILSDVSGNIADSVAIPALPENVSYALGNGEWKQTSAITPWFENSDAGYSAYRQSMTVTGSPLLITEVMASNAMTVADADGSYNDWVEITNTSAEEYDVSGCGLSDDAGDPLKWRFPDAKLGTGESVLVFCSGKTVKYGGEGPMQADFKLSPFNTTVVLSDSRGRTMDSVAAQEMPSDWSYARSVSSGAPSDSWALTCMPTPGYPNTGEGFTAFMQNNPFTTGDIIISEVLCSNNQIDFDETGASSDYIEIQNRGTNAVNLSGFGLTDNAGNPAKFRFPDITLQPGGYTVVYATGADDAQTGSMQASFKLSRLGNTLALFNAQGQLIDRCFIGEVPQNISVGRAQGQTAISYFETPTPGQANGEGKTGIAAEVTFSQNPGKYGGAIELSLFSSDGCDIYYTTDGSTPTESSQKYTGPVTVSETSSVRARAYNKGYIPSNTATATFFIGSQHTLPVVSIATEQAKLFDPATGIYSNSKKDVEIPASFELFDEGGQRVFQQNISLAMTGGMTLQLREQKSFAIYARSQYGKSTMAYPFFDNRPYTEYKSVILRTAARDDTQTKLSTYVALDLVDGQMEVVTQAAKPCVVYIDGKYWGIYFLMEKRNKYMVAQHEGITDSAAIDSINLAKGLRDNLTSSGSYKGYAEIYNYARSHDLSVQENYEWIDARLDTKSFMDFIINEIYVANNDVLGNMQYYQVPPDGKWKQIYQDLDIAFYPKDAVALRMDSSTAGSDIFNALLKNQGWKDAFIERFAWALMNIYNVDRVTAAVEEAAALIRGEVEADYQRWSDERPQLTDWEAGITRMKNFAKNRGRAVVDDLNRHFSLSQQQKQMLEDAIK